MTIPYVAGTVSVTAGNAVVTGVGTAWATALLTGGMFGLDSANGNPVPILSVDSDTQITLAKPWRGTSAATQAYWIMRDTAYGQQTVANASALSQLISELRSAAIASFAGLTPASNKIPYFTGAQSAALSDLTDKGRELLGKATSADVLQALGVTTFARQLLDDVDLTTALDTLGVSNFVKSLLDDASASAFYNTLGPVPNAQIRGDIGPDKSYRQGNILGSVSQSSGVPSGAVIERGSNGNGEYVRFADGTQICMRVVALGTTTIQPNAFESLSSGLSYAAAFASAPAVFVNYDGAFSYHVLMATPTPSTSSTNNIYAKNTDTVARALSGSYRVLAVGRWF